MKDLIEVNPTSDPAQQMFGVDAGVFSLLFCLCLCVCYVCVFRGLCFELYVSLFPCYVLCHCCLLLCVLLCVCSERVVVLLFVLCMCLLVYTGCVVS